MHRRLTITLHAAHMYTRHAAYVKYYYVDDSFNGLDWDAAYQAALEQSYGAETGDEVDAITTALLKRLGDPFTRLLSPQASRTYKAEKQGAVRPACAAAHTQPPRIPVTCTATTRELITAGTLVWHRHRLLSSSKRGVVCARLCASRQRGGGSGPPHGRSGRRVSAAAYR